MKYSFPLMTLALTIFITTPVICATVTVTPDDDWTALENAQAGDVVEVAPGTYRFRVHLDNAGTAESPIVIRAQDPNNRPVWDLVGDEQNPVSDAPGSYTAGDRGRGCWQIGPDGAHYEISGIVFRNCRDDSSAGFRAVNSGPVKLVNCLFESNTNGLTGASTNLVVEHCEFRDNGKTFEGGNPTHNIYIYGGRFAMRYCYNHDSHEGQLFHVRAAESRIEYNWLARPANYVGDIMSCEYLCDGTAQHMTLMGNVIIQGTPENASQIFALYSDEDTGMTEMNIFLYYNTIIGTPREPGRTHNLLNLRNDSIDTHATLYNNIIYGMGTVAEVADEAMSNWSVTGAANWLSTGTAVRWLTGSVEGTDPGFVDAANLNYYLTENAGVRNMADASLGEVPDREYYLNEETSMGYRQRESAMDLGAFEFGTAGDVIVLDTDTGTEHPDTGTEHPGTEHTDADTGTGTDTGTEPPDTGSDDTATEAVGNSDSETENSSEAVDDTGSDSEGCGCTVVRGKGWPSLLRLLMQ